jgi:hypothetical protein
VDYAVTEAEEDEKAKWQRILDQAVDMSMVNERIRRFDCLFDHEWCQESTFTPGTSVAEHFFVVNGHVSCLVQSPFPLRLLILLL